MQYLELLAPAKNVEQGIAAINHGADAVYIGAPLFGARVAAGNTVDDIEQLVNYAHLFHSKVFATVNTLLYDNELEEARQLINQLYNIGVDALIIQDMGLLEMELPPIALHASTQVHNYDIERIKFMEQVGFRRIILARETSLEQMQIIRKNTSVELEAFVQGALCVCFSGQCYLSQYLNERSGNRGCCGQPCRSSYDLYNEQGQLLRRQEHLLSLKDFNASQHIASMIDAGICSFKIEGRLKDLSYVKNTTAYYRQLLDKLMHGKEDLRPASDGVTRLFFTPDLSRTFNRGFTDYFLENRKAMASIATQKSIGKRLGKVTKVEKGRITIDTQEEMTAGDGLCFLNTRNEMDGFLVNHVVSNTIVPNRMPENLLPGTELWRNNDFAFEKQMQGKTAERKIEVSIILSDSPNGISLLMSDEQGHQATVAVDCQKEAARDVAKADEQIVRQLSKTGNSPFVVKSIQIQLAEHYFLPASLLNELRRQAVAQLSDTRTMANRPQPVHLEKNDIPYPTDSLDYRANIVNRLSRQFYERHGVTTTENGLETSHDYDNKALMTTKYCLRYELKQCLLHKNNKTVDPDYQGTLYLRNNKNYFRLSFDCKRCEMQIIKAPPLPLLEGR
ncbi:MAG: U32 family peptidase [Bacteroidales bacterium]|nr:U32 family peptidase [Bacteroidales bacterium]